MEQHSRNQTGTSDLVLPVTRDEMRTHTRAGHTRDTLWRPLRVHVRLRDHISLRTRKSSPPSHSCGASTKICSARWTQADCVRASSQNIYLGICLRNASPMFTAALSRMAVCTGRSSRQDAAQAAQHGRCAFEGARLRLWWSARPAQAGKLTGSFDCEWYFIARFVMKSPSPPPPFSLGNNLMVGRSEHVRSYGPISGLCLRHENRHAR